MKRVLVTGAAGFIGAAVSRSLIERGDSVLGIDNLNDYYDTNLKIARLQHIQASPARDNFSYATVDISNQEALQSKVIEHRCTHIVHLAAQAGVRYSITNPHAYAQSNLVGFLNILETARHQEIKHLVYASSSSVYGGNIRVPFKETDSVDHPVSQFP